MASAGGTITGTMGMGTIDIAAPIPSDGTGGTLDIAGFFYTEAGDYSVSIDNGMGGFVALTPDSEDFTLTLSNVGTLEKMFTLGGSLLEAARMDGVVTLQISQMIASMVPSDNARTYFAVLNYEGADAVPAVPEPATMTLLGIGALVGCVSVRRRRKASKSVN